MTITDAIHAYNVGNLIALSDRQLEEVITVLIGKIVMLNQVVRSESVAPELRADLRKYEAIRNEVARLIEKRKDSTRLLRCQSDFVSFFDTAETII